ncbi:MAG: endo-1,4-beta-xylanase, partial [Prevotellaceae bacterium]|nr:endo-1,4-beta-xylanase [Prevotellaceae bacterium]
MKKIPFLLLGAAALLSSCCNCKCDQDAAQEPGLKEFTGKYFYLGTALNTDHIIGADVEGVATTVKHFAAISPENCLKPEEVHPFENIYEWTIPDAYVEFGQKNNMFIHGHTLVWHSQCPDWFFFDEKGDTASYDLLKQRLETHIAT